MFFSGTCIAAVLNSIEIYKVKVKCRNEVQIHFVSHINLETSVSLYEGQGVYIYILIILNALHLHNLRLAFHAHSRNAFLKCKSSHASIGH